MKVLTTCDYENQQEWYYGRFEDDFYMFYNSKYNKGVWCQASKHKLDRLKQYPMILLYE